MMVELTTIFGLAETLAIIVGVVIALQQLRDIKRTRETELETRQAQLFMQLYQRSLSEEANRSWWNHVLMTWEDYDDFDSEIGPSSPDGAVKIHTLWQQYQGVGLLLMDGLISHEMAYRLSGGWRAVMLWLKYEKIIKETRERYNNPDYLDGFEYLGTEMMKYRERKGFSNELSEEFVSLSQL